MTDQPRLDHVQCVDTPSPTRMALHRMAYWEWGDPANPRVLVCAHGLARQGRDFDTLARALCATYRVVCPDVVGRGRSDRLENPMNYQLAQYVADMVTLLARLNAATVDWVGTSMGGLIGLGVAALSGSPLRRLVSTTSARPSRPTSLVRIGTYLGQPAHWRTLDEAADALWAISSSFGPHTREQWLALIGAAAGRPTATASSRTTTRRSRCPSAPSTPEIAKFGEALLWQAYDGLTLADAAAARRRERSALARRRPRR